MLFTLDALPCQRQTAGKTNILASTCDINMNQSQKSTEKNIYKLRIDITKKKYIY